MKESELLAGYARVDITPPLGIAMPGYFKIRNAKQVLDPLEAVCVAFSDGTRRALLIAVDTEAIADEVVAEAKAAVSSATGVPQDAILIHATHTHTGGDLHRRLDELRQPEDALASQRLTFIYIDHTVRRLADAAAQAIADLAPATLSASRSRAPRISFGRRYLMRDGKIRTNPGVLNPDIVKAVGTADDEVQLLRIDRDGRMPIAVINFQTHPDVVGGETVSADWPGFTRRVFEAALGGEALAVFVNGAQGDVNHVCVDPRPGELNGMCNDFDDVYRGYGHARHMGCVVAGAALSVWAKCAPLEGGPISFGVRQVRVPSQMPSPGELPEARRFVELHRSGRDGDIPFEGMELTTAVADAERKLRLENGPAFFDMPVSAIAIGRAAAFVGFPGEPFNDIGVALKAKSPFGMTMAACLANGSRGYFPFSDAYAQGGYESRSSDFGPTVAQDLIDGALGLLESLPAMRGGAGAVQRPGLPQRP